MNTTNLNAELFRELSYIADDEGCMKKLLVYIKQLIAQKDKLSATAEDDEHYRPTTKAELMADLNEMCEEVKLIRAGKLKGKTCNNQPTGKINNLLLFLLKI